jgi:HPt (histidine-containing phosphotransfer) domain-containing protein
MIDMDRLLEFATGMGDFSELITLYISQTTEQLEQIRVAYRSADAAQVSRVAHSCAGASATCGMLRIVPLLRHLEHISAAGDLKNAAVVIDEIDREYARIRNFLETYPKLAPAA